MNDFVFLETSRQLSTAFPVDYNLIYVGLSIAIAVFSAYTAFLVAERIAFYTTKKLQYSWAIAGGLALGGGVWAMHFIGIVRRHII